MLRLASLNIRSALRQRSRSTALLTAHKFYLNKPFVSKGVPSSAHCENESPELPISGAARVMPQDVETERRFNRATSTEVWELKGVFSNWVQDVLGYHTPLGLREPQPSSGAEEDNITDGNQDYSKPREKASAEAGLTAASTEEDVDIAQPAEAPHCSSSSNGRGRTGAFSFYGPLTSFEVSPVFEWMGCLWQWRPMEVQLARSATYLLAEGSTAAHGKPVVVGGGGRDQDNGGAGSHGSGHKATPASRRYYLVPFLLLPTHEVVAGRPRLHTALRDAVLAHRTCFCEANSGSSIFHNPELCRLQQRGMLASLTPALWVLTAPTPVGDLPLDVSKQHDEHSLSVFNVMERQLASKTYAKDHATTIAPLIPPTEETWEAATQEQHNDRYSDKAPRGGISDTPYVRVICTESQEEVVPRAAAAPAALAVAPKPSEPSRLLPLRRNVVGGGLAELLLTVDRYAALIVRGELTLSAACWATLCDTKSWWVVQRLRLTPREVERELVAAMAAHRRWQRRALARNRTLVGKSSHGVRFDEYPSLARWIGN
ncbi:hypothetical protein ABL78_5493 [Leptomonas seymouri]|uniref:Uncharacterized protein n=1 Tax=Leptomonas seymouri TaxID=5684 RepID=A0A0N0P4L4_LEPSE|nr:hypothetical protein ABL78_5493 [Leptomonas seymouri]|eukprot:KPI85439.1 hypothetical protein ABL78_5493 [Leptomonas seymouri]